MPLGQTGPGGVALVVDVWRDPSNGEFAFRFHGDSDVDLLRGKTIFSVTDGLLSDETVYLHAGDAWTVIHDRYGVTAARTLAALKAGETVARPALMTVPKPDPVEYTYAHDFGTDLAALRRAAGFAVPSPGRHLDGRTLANVSLDRNTSFPNAAQWDVAVITYSSKSSFDNQAVLNVAPPDSSSGSSYSTFFFKSHHRISGPGLDARITSDGDAIMRYHDSYVFVRLDEKASDSHRRAVLGQIARS